MARGASGEIYQVDLIAALFGGFMISWLVSAQETEFQVYSKPLKFATLEMRVAGNVTFSGGATLVWYNALSYSTVEESGCIGTELAEELIGGVKRYVACSSESASKLNTTVTSPGYDINYWNNTVDACNASSPGSPFPRTQSYYSNWALTVELPNFLSAVGTIHRRFDPSELATSTAKPIFGFTRSTGNCLVKRDRLLANQVFLVSNFDQLGEDSISFPIVSGKGALLLTGTLATSSVPVRQFYYSDLIDFVNPSSEIEVTSSTKLSNPVVQTLLCVFSEGTETCYGGEQSLTHSGAPSLTLLKGVTPW